MGKRRPAPRTRHHLRRLMANSHRCRAACVQRMCWLALLGKSCPISASPPPPPQWLLSLLSSPHNPRHHRRHPRHPYNYLPSLQLFWCAAGVGTPVGGVTSAVPIRITDGLIRRLPPATRSHTSHMGYLLCCQFAQVVVIVIRNDHPIIPPSVPCHVFRRRRCGDSAARRNTSCIAPGGGRPVRRSGRR